jgi:hypothetical protein
MRFQLLRQPRSIADMIKLSGFARSGPSAEPREDEFRETEPTVRTTFWW